MFEIQQADWSKLILPRSAGAAPSDNDGVHLDSEPFIQACIFSAAASACGIEEFSPAQRALVSSTFGQADNIMSQDLFDKLSQDPELGSSQLLRSLNRESFVPYFIEARRDVWREWTSSGKIEPKPFMHEYLDELRSSGRLLGLVTGMPFDIVRESVTHVLKADDLIPDTRDRRVCCDDPRLGGRGKPDPKGYELGMSHFVDTFDIAPADMWVIEDRANGAVAALKARYEGPNSKYSGQAIGHVIVIPDEHDVNPVELWDKKNLMQEHLSGAPEDRARLHFLRSLEDLKFT